ncbi:MAG: hypothetical protein IT307_13980 [Chloroflexi bacterium]|nr:hypothetical protein [Chloroflexota bacterium]
MATALPDPPAVISDRLYALLLSSPRLRQQLFPEGLSTSPYRILDYQQTLILGDKTGTRAVFARRERIQCQQDSVAAILDHFWGDGVTLAGYATTAGRVRDSFKDDGRRHLVLELPRPLQRGETLDFSIQRTVMEGFVDEEEWDETILDHPIDSLSRTIVFPKERPCQAASLIYQGQTFPLHVLEMPEGDTLVRVRIAHPKPHTAYIISWRW